jgi:hypothetical protein
MVSNEELKYPSWQSPLREVILEFDHEKMVERIPRVETLISERYEALSSDTDHHDERQALEGAASVLRRLKQDKLSAGAS